MFRRLAALSLLSVSVLAAQAAPASPRDTARATIAGASVMVDYGRPSMKGRAIWGGLVPYGQVWRLGANAATTLVTEKALVADSTTIPAGKYTLYLLPTEQGAELIVNKQTGQWGTVYDAKQDLARLKLTKSAAAAPVEKFAITIAAKGNGATMSFAWDKTEYHLAVTAK
ncbi:MAG: DUF2911 domain-containing protein [Gemmatimonadaceae bacterium]|nr:DUF2911 domain-containing protein [Gemmatimonadaceae bacterium]